MNHKTLTSWLALGACACLPATSLAEPRADAPSIDTLVVLGSRLAIAPEALAASPRHFEPDLLRDSESAFASDLLHTLPSASVARSGGPGSLTQVRLRGGEADHVQVRLDGIKANDPATGGSYDFAHLRSPTLERMELVPGPSGALWGSDAVAGALHLQTLQTRGIRLRTAAGSHRTREGTLSAGVESDNGAFSVLADHYRSDGINISEGPGEDDGYAVTTLAMTGNRSLTDAVELSASLRRIGATVEFDPTPAPSFVPAEGDRESEIERLLAGIELAITPDAHWQHQLRLNLLDSEHRDHADARLTDIRRGERYHAGWQSAWSGQGLLPGDQTWILALESERETFVQRGRASTFGDPNQNQHMSQHAGVLEWRYTPLDRLHLNVALRRDWNQDFANRTTWRTGLRGELPAGLGDAWASLATAVKNPAFTERFGYTPDSFLGNPELKPERARTFELGWQKTLLEDAATLELVWHNTRLVDEIDGFAFDQTTGLGTARNRNRNSRRQGLEAELALRLASQTRISTRYAWLDATEPDTSGNSMREVRRPQHSGSLILRHQAFSKRLRLYGELTWTGARDDQSFATFPATTVTLDDYLLVRASASWQLNRELELFARIENLTDADYQEVLGYQTPGRQLTAGFRWAIAR